MFQVYKRKILDIGCFWAVGLAGGWLLFTIASYANDLPGFKPEWFWLNAKQTVRIPAANLVHDLDSGAPSSGCSAEGLAVTESETHANTSVSSLSVGHRLNANGEGEFVFQILKGETLICEHTVSGIKTPPSLASPVLVTKSLIYFATTDGIRAVNKDFLLKSLFQVKLTAALVSPLPADSELLDFWEFGQATDNTAVRVGKARLVTPSNRLSARHGDLVLKVRTSTGQEILSPLDWQQEILPALAHKALGLLAMMDIVEPQGSGSFPINEVLHENRNQILSAGWQADAFGNETTQRYFRKIVGSLNQRLGQPLMLRLRARINDLKDSSRHLNQVDESLNIVEAGATDQARAMQAFHERILLKMNNSTTMVESLKKITGILALGLSLDLTAVFTDGNSTTALLATVAHLMGWVNHVPGLSSLASDAAASAHYFAENWAFSRLAFVTSLVWSVRPLATFAAHRYYKRAGKTWNQAQAFFNWGLRSFAHMNYAFQKGIWEGLLRQRNVYRALSLGVPLSTPGVFNHPLASAESLAANAATIETHAEAAKLRRTRAKVLAAILITKSKLKSTAPIDPVTVMLLLEAAEKRPLVTLSTNLIDEAVFGPTFHAAWSALLPEVENTLSQLGSAPGTQDINEAEVTRYLEVMSPILEKLQNSPRIVSLLKGKANQFGNWIAGALVPNLIFGKAWYELFKKYKSFEIDVRNADSANVQYVKDTDFSLFTFAATAPVTLGAVFSNASAALETGFFQTQQVFLSAATGALDEVTTTQVNNELPNPYAPVISQTLRRGFSHRSDSDPTAVGLGREQTPLEALNSIWTTIWNPNAKASFFGGWLANIDNIGGGFQGLFLAGWLGRSLGVFLNPISWAHIASPSATVALMGSTALTAGLKQANVMVSKHAVRYSAAAGLSIGYFLPYIPILFSLNAMKDAVAENQRIVENFDQALDLSLRLRDFGLLEETRQGLKILYTQNGQSLPPEFESPISDWRAAEALQTFFIEHPPLPTVHSLGLARFMNTWLGAVTTTAIYLQTNRLMWNSHAPVLPQLGRNLSYLAATWMALTIARPLALGVVRLVADTRTQGVRPAVLGRVRDLKNACQWALGTSGEAMKDPGSPD